MKLKPRYNLSFNVGEAGTGKTEELVKSLIREASFINYNTPSDFIFQRFVVLAPTHNAVENVKSRFMKEILAKKVKKYEKVKENDPMFGKLFKTIHSFFRIDFKTNKILGPVNNTYPDLIYIDEFSMIDRDMFEEIVDMIPEKTKIICFGDPLQLNSVYKPGSKYDSITFDDMNAIEILLKTLGISSFSLNSEIYKHIYQSILFNYLNLSNRDVFEVYKENHRQNAEISKLIDKLNDESLLASEQGVNSLIELFKPLFIPKLNVRQYINDGYAIIGSTYSVLQQVYDHYSETKSGIPGYVTIEQRAIDGSACFRYLHLYPGCIVRFLETSSEYGWFNGQLGKVEQINGNGIIISSKVGSEEYRYNVKMQNGKYPFGPENILTVHKAQGYGIDKVVVCIDNMFELTMMYTAITRAKSSLLFYSNDTKVKVEENTVKLIKSYNASSLGVLRYLLTKIFENRHELLISFDKVNAKLNPNTNQCLTNSLRLIPKRYYDQLVATGNLYITNYSQDICNEILFKPANEEYKKTIPDYANNRYIQAGIVDLSTRAIVHYELQ